MDNKLIGEKIKKYRKKAKLSQAQLAELVDLSDKHIGRIESGLYSPSVKNFLKIVNILKINISEFGFEPFIETKSNTYSELLNLINSSNEDEILMFLDIIKVLKTHRV